MLDMNILLNSLSAKNVVFNLLHDSPTHIANFICTYVKYYIYTCKIQKKRPNYDTVVRRIEVHQEVEKYNAKKVGMINKHCVRWAPIFPELNEERVTDM